MTKQITILGLGQIGTSIGLGLSKFGEEFHRVGYDENSGMANLAKKNSAIDETKLRLINSVEDADIIIISMGFDKIEQTLQIIGGGLKDDVILLDTSPIRQISMDWAKEYLPENCNYIGFTPMISPDFLEKMERGSDAANGDLFNGGLFAITASQNTASDAVDLAIDFAGLLKATVLFADIGEIDGMMASVHIMPQLLSAALINSNMRRGSWKEGRKFAGRPFAISSSMIDSQDTPAAIAKAAVMNKENTVRVVDDFIRELQSLSNMISEGSTQTLEDILEKARLRRSTWMSEKGNAEWAHQKFPEMDLKGSKRNWGGSLLGRWKKK